MQFLTLISRSIAMTGRAGMITGVLEYHPILALFAKSVYLHLMKKDEFVK